MTVEKFHVEPGGPATFVSLGPVTLQPDFQIGLDAGRLRVKTRLIH